MYGCNKFDLLRNKDLLLKSYKAINYGKNRKSLSTYTNIKYEKDLFNEKEVFFMKNKIQNKACGNPKNKNINDKKSRHSKFLVASVIEDNKVENLEEKIVLSVF